MFGRIQVVFGKILKQVQNKKMASDLHRTAQPHTFAMFPSWRIL